MDQKIMDQEVMDQTGTPQTLTTMEAAFTLHDRKELIEEFWTHQARMGPIAASAAGFVSVTGGPIARSPWLYFSGKWQTPDLMNAWHHNPKHRPMQDAAHARWFSSCYIRKWRLPAESEAISGPVFCETSIAAESEASPDKIEGFVDAIACALEDYGPRPFETLIGQFERQPFQFIGPVQEFPKLAPARYLLLTHWDSLQKAEHWMHAPALMALGDLGSVSSQLHVSIRHNAGEREYLRPDGMQREFVHAPPP